MERAGSCGGREEERQRGLTRAGQKAHSSCGENLVKLRHPETRLCNFLKSLRRSKPLPFNSPLSCGQPRYPLKDAKGHTDGHITFTGLWDRFEGFDTTQPRGCLRQFLRQPTWFWSQTIRMQTVIFWSLNTAHHIFTGLYSLTGKRTSGLAVPLVLTPQSRNKARKQVFIKQNNTELSHKIQMLLVPSNLRYVCCTVDHNTKLYVRADGQAMTSQS